MKKERGLKKQRVLYKYMSIKEALQSRRLFFDGAMGTELYKRGFTGDTARVNLSANKTIEEIHREYVRAGADIITANTFGAYKHAHRDFANIIESAVSAARAAVADADGKKPFVALDMGATGLMLEPYGDVSLEACANIFFESAQLGADCGVDLILIETMMDINELNCAVSAAVKTGLPVMATMSFNANGRTMYGASVKDMTEALTHPNVIAAGMNCGFGPELYMFLLDELLTATSLPVILQPNAGLPRSDTGRGMVYDCGPDEFATLMSEAAKKGVRLLGGCCGTTPGHIAEMINRI